MQLHSKYRRPSSTIEAILFYVIIVTAQSNEKDSKTKKVPTSFYGFEKKTF